MADTPIRAGPSALGTAMSTVYTAPALTKAMVKRVHACNQSGAAATFTLGIGSSTANADAVAGRLYHAVDVPVGSPVADDTWIVLNAGDVVRAQGSVASAITLSLHLVEVS